MRWYVAEIHQQRVQFALQQLHRQQFEVFLPYLESIGVKRGLKRTILEPLFPGYMFIKLDVHVGGWQRINGTFGVKRLLAFGDEPAPVPVGFVEGLVGVKLQKPYRMVPGITRVRVTSGQFEGMEGVFQESSSDRVKILLAMLGRSVVVTLSPENIVAA